MVLVVGEQLHDEVVDLVKRQHLAVRLLDGHGDERYVGVGRFRGPKVPIAADLVLKLVPPTQSIFNLGWRNPCLLHTCPLLFASGGWTGVEEVIKQTAVECKSLLHPSPVCVYTTRRLFIVE